MLLIAVITALVANPVPVFSSEGITSILMDKFSSLSAGNAARLSLCSQAIPCPPWTAGAINAVALTKLEFKTAAWYYFKATTFPGLVALAVCWVWCSWACSCDAWVQKCNRHLKNHRK